MMDGGVLVCGGVVGGVCVFVCFCVRVLVHRICAVNAPVSNIKRRPERRLIVSSLSGRSREVRVKRDQENRVC